MDRLLQPLLKINGQYQTISFEDAFQQIFGTCKDCSENSTLVMAAGDYTNEELYLIQRLARTGLHTNAIGSFDYYNRGTAFFIDKNDIVPFAELFASGLFICIFDENADTESMRVTRKIIDTCEKTPRYVFNTPSTLNISHYGNFFRCLNHYLLHENLAKGIYVDVLGKNFDTYKKNLLNEDFQQLLSLNGLKQEEIAAFADLILHADAPVFLVWERFLDERGIIELENSCMLLDIQAKPSTGFLNIKADLNSQGLFDMGLFPEQSIGGRKMDDESVQLMADIFKMPVASQPVNISERLAAKGFQQCLLFNSTNAPLPEEVRQQVEQCTFSVLHTSCWDGQCDADLVLPAALPDEVYGTFTDSTRVPHNSKPENPGPLALNNLQQLSAVSELFGLAPLTDPTDIFLEYASFFQGGCRSKYRHFFR